MKVIDLRTSPEEEKELAVKEANLLKSLQHEHVLAYTDSFEHDGALCIVTEYCAQGNLPNASFFNSLVKKKLWSLVFLYVLKLVIFKLYYKKLLQCHLLFK